jgi:hypothetical protein
MNCQASLTRREFLGTGDVPALKGRPTVKRRYATMPHFPLRLCCLRLSVIATDAWLGLAQLSESRPFERPSPGHPGLTLPGGRMSNRCGGGRKISFFGLVMCVRACRASYFLPGFAGNSLGAVPKRIESRVSGSVCGDRPRMLFWRWTLHPNPLLTSCPLSTPHHPLFFPIMTVCTVLLVEPGLTRMTNNHAGLRDCVKFRSFQVMESFRGGNRIC